MKKFDKAEIIKFIKFLVVGCINTLITLVVIYILMHLFRVDYKTSNAAGYVVGLVNSFFWNKLWVFKKRNGGLFKEVALFVIFFLICYGAQFICLLVLVEKMGVDKSLSQFLAMIVYTLLNFIFNRLFTFAVKKESSI